MAIELWKSRIQFRTYTFYPARSEFISTNSIFAEWVCIAPQSGKFEYETEVATDEMETGEIEFGDLIFVRPRAIFNRHVTTAPLSYHVLQWSFVDEENQVYENLWRAGKWTVRDTTRLSSTLALLPPLLGRQDAWSVRRREHLLEELMHMAWESRQASPTPDPLMSEAARLMRERAGELLTMSEISGSVGLGPVQFTRRFRAAFGQNPVEYLTEVRLAHAQSMLIETPATLDEIAMKCGWASGAYLSFVFEKHFKMTPGRFRKRHRV